MGAEPRAAAARCGGKPGNSRAFPPGRKGRLQPRAKAFCQTALTGSSRYWHRQSAGGCRAEEEHGLAQRRAPLPRGREEGKEKKIEDLKTSGRWVPSIWFRHQCYWRTSRLPAHSSPAQPGEGETQVIIRSCSHPVPRAGALPKPPRAGGRACSHPSRGEQESRFASVAFSSSPVTVPGAHGTGGSSPRSGQQQKLLLRHPTAPGEHGFVRATRRQKGS